MIKNKPIIITLIIILSIIAIFLVVGLVFMLRGKFNFKTRIMNFGFGNKVSENLPKSNVISNGNYTICMNDKGDGFSKYNNILINRFKET